ncbi:Uncharacterised protein [Slackia heliotrinireducens]|jgi:hypothetical protein|uniref:Uncharacterized protein n=1 Tax=Slackia heliotrinireducens (strain ATCC 29202 / DSM 20476 / NCTC 11029 / RHS 1) TaxID=471855 RepID=C7N1M2_SLAHD|nr:hypothetical protein Shel_02460 [Slackia heliotrinireducens DSM 20476]VEG98749.1 Uncharacterised protein [Slackia heliotrinireducens]
MAGGAKKITADARLRGTWRGGTSVSRQIARIFADRIRSSAARSRSPYRRVDDDGDDQATPPRHPSLK